MLHRGHLASLAATPKLRNMCLGIWNRLRHERGVARRARGEEVLVDAEVEVEQKFLVPSDCSARLEAAGAVLVGEKEVTDVYWDTAAAALMARDTWLRQRGGMWELKVPAGGEGQAGGGATSYTELSSLPAIREAVREAGVLEELEELETMVEVRCTRQQWRLAGMEVVVDKMADGYTVGEVEVMARPGGRVAALARVQKAAAALGFTAVHEGKVAHCMRLARPELWRRLELLWAASH